MTWYFENMGLRGMFKYIISKKIRPSATTRSTPPANTTLHNGHVLNLRPGEWVEVKSIDEIMATLDNNRRNKGLLWMTGMSKYCGNSYRVFRRVERIILESNSELRKMKNTVILEDVVCGGETTSGLCRRAECLYWREIWLRRTDEPE